MNIKTRIIHNLGLNKNAIIDQDKQYSYIEFGNKVNTVYNYLIHNQIKKVLFQLPQSIDSYAIIIASYFARTTFCAVHMEHPKNRIKKYIEAFSPQLVILNDFDFRELKQKADVFNYDEKIDNGSELFASELENNIAYVLFTFGSAGTTPKGIPIERQALDEFLNAIIPIWGIEEHDIYGQYSNLGFDLSIADIFCAFYAGATIVPIKTKGQKILPAKVIKKYNISFWHSVPSVVDLIKKSKMGNDFYLKSLKKVSFCGERLFKSQLEFLFSANPDLIVFNTYGPTETTLFCTLVELNKDNYLNLSDKTATIGKPIHDNIRISINYEDDDAENIGELIIEGNSVSPGYINADNSKSFFYDFARQCRGYKTGDYVYMKHGHLFFYGRKDRQIKHNGNRIELSEIDACLRNKGIPSITSLKNGRIISFVVADVLNKRELMDYLRINLPTYSLPQKIITLKELPYTANGKIDIMSLLKEID